MCHGEDDRYHEVAIPCRSFRALTELLAPSCSACFTLSRYGLEVLMLAEDGDMIVRMAEDSTLSIALEQRAHYGMGHDEEVRFHLAVPPLLVFAGRIGNVGEVKMAWHTRSEGVGFEWSAHHDGSDWRRSETVGIVVKKLALLPDYRWLDWRNLGRWAAKTTPHRIMRFAAERTELTAFKIEVFGRRGQPEMVCTGTVEYDGGKLDHRVTLPAKRKEPTTKATGPPSAPQAKLDLSREKLERFISCTARNPVRLWLVDGPGESVKAVAFVGTFGQDGKCTAWWRTDLALGN